MSLLNGLLLFQTYHLENPSRDLFFDYISLKDVAKKIKMFALLLFSMVSQSKDKTKTLMVYQNQAS